MEDLTGGGSNSSRVLRFDGVSGYVSLGNPPVLQLEGALTIEACVKNEASTRRGQASMPHRNIVAHGHDQMNEVFLRINLFTQQYEVGCWIGSSDRTCMAACQIPEEDSGRWVHLAGTFDGSAWNLYRNGELAAHQKAEVGAVRVAGAEWAIGAKGGGGDRFWHGCIACVHLWNRARSQDEIATTARDSPTGNEVGLLRHWPMNDGGGKSVSEEVGGEDGQVKGGCVWVSAALQTVVKKDTSSFYELLGVDKVSCAPRQWSEAVEV
jgi:hypothetical protein